MRLALGMGRKSALAGLWWGGGKGVIAADAGSPILEGAGCDEDMRRATMEEYGRFQSSLCGVYVSAEDAGLYVKDLDVVYTQTRYTTCISPRLGGSGNPSGPTAAGVAVAMAAAVDSLGMGTLKGKRVAIQGCGNVAVPLMSILLREQVAHVTCVDISPSRVAAAQKLFEGEKRVDISVVDSDDMSILASDVDIVSPCAFGGSLNAQTIPTITAPIVAGAANNQLLFDDDDTDALLHAAGITYCPDFVINRMGIVACADEPFGKMAGAAEDPAIQRHLSREWEHGIWQTTQKILARSQESGVSTRRVANEAADGAAMVEHPIWGHRTAHIIDSLRAADWASGEA
jgi:glutamate dehydrogenase/leucine dehydrogenase